MKEIKKMKERMLSIVLTFAMVVSLFVGIAPMEVQAAGFYTPIIDRDSITLYASGCLKDITITVQADGYYADAYGRIGIHNGASPYNWDNRFISSGCNYWPEESEFVNGDSTFVGFANGNEFLWTDGNPHTITFTFDDGKIDLSQTQNYNIYLWTRSSKYGVYTDALLGILKTEDGKLLDDSGNTLFDSSTVTPSSPAQTIASLADLVIIEDKTVTFEVPTDEYTYISSVIPVEYLSGYTAEQYCTQIMGAVGKEVVDYNSIDMSTVEANKGNDALFPSNSALESSYCQNVDLSADEYSSFGGEYIVTIYKIKSDEVKSATYDSAETNPYFTSIGTEAYLYPLYGVYARAVTYAGSEDISQHTHDGITYQAIEQSNDVDLQQAGNYYLTEDITLNDSISISGTVNLCLNGYILNASSITVSDGAALNVFDCGSTEHRYKSSETSYWTLDESGDRVIEDGILCSKIINNGTFNLKDGTICGVNGCAINNNGTATIEVNGAVIGNYNSTTGYDNSDKPTNIPAIVYNGKGAKFSNSGKINNNVAKIHTVCNDGGTFTNEKTGTINENIATTTSDGTAAGGVANYTRNTSYISKFHNYGQINYNTSARSSGGVLNKGGEFTNYSTGQINGNVAARHCGGVDNTSNAYTGEYRGTFFKNYGQVNDNKVLATNGGGNGAGIYNEAKAAIYNYGEVCGNTAVAQGGGIFFNDGSGTLYVGGKSTVTGNKDSSGNNSNICIGSGKVILFDGETPLADEAVMGVYLYSSGRINGTVSSGYTTLYGNTEVTDYFFADTPTQRVKLESGEVYLYTSNHTHSWTYSVNETTNTITATCSDDCDTTKEAAITINATNMDYSGTAYDALEISGTWPVNELDLEDYIVWYVSTDDGSYDSEIAPTEIGEYKVVVTVGGVSVEVEFSIVEPMATPVITIQPEDKAVQEGETATFSVTASGENLSYQWQINRNDGNGFVNINGATSATYTTSVVDMGCDGFKYQCIVTNEDGSVTTTQVTLTVVHIHSLILVPETSPTCTTTGNTLYYKCESENCDYLFVDAEGNTPTTLVEVIISELGHAMSTATCTEASKCQRNGCDHTVGTALGHDMSEAACTEASKCQRSGCDHIEGALGHDWSGEWTVTKEATTTEEGKKETLCVRGCGQKKAVTIPATGVSADNSNIEKDAEVAPDAPIDKATLDNSKDELLEADNIFTEDEKQQIINGADARVWVEISKTDESKIASEDKSKIEQEAAKIMGDNLNITYFDANLFKQVGNGVKTEITEPDVAIKITIKIPNELLNTDQTVTREYKILRLHEGQVDVISGTFNAATGEFSFESDKFSTYAIVNKDVPVGGDNDEPTPGDDNDDPAPNDDVVKPNDDKKDEVPKTGDSNKTLYAFLLMLLSGLGILFCSRRKEVWNKDN